MPKLSSTKKTDSQYNQSGFSLVETLVALSIASVVGVTAMIKVHSIKQHIQATEDILSLDSFEQQWTNLLSNPSVVHYSLKKQGQGNCFNKKACPAKTKAPLTIFLPGQNKKTTGKNVFYNRKGQRCSGPCRGYYLKTFYNVACPKRKCVYQNFISLSFEIIDIESKQRRRSGSVDIQPPETGEHIAFLNLKCPTGQLMRGVSLSGAAICTPQNQVVYIDRDGSTAQHQTKLQPIECQQNTTQQYIKSIQADGSFECAERFW